MAVNNEVEEISSNSFNEKIKKGIVIVDFFAEWCMPCVMMAPIIEEMQQKFPNFKFFKANIDENSELASRFNVLSVPTLIIFKNGRESDRIVGSLPSNILEEKLRRFV